MPEAMLGTPELKELVQTMLDTMRAAPGVGLAAPQIGVPLQARGGGRGVAGGAWEEGRALEQAAAAWAIAFCRSPHIAPPHPNTPSVQLHFPTAI